MLLLVTLGGLGYQEVAAALGISSGTVGSRPTRARKKLDSALTDPDLQALRAAPAAACAGCGTGCTAAGPPGSGPAESPST